MSKDKKKKILICNDDGHFSWATKYLANSLNTFADVLITIPDRERSAVSHAISLHKPLRVRELNHNSFVIDGTPADCVRIGLWKNKHIDLVISGVNSGPNLGNDVIYSGTVAGAREAVLMGKSAIAVSLDGNKKEDFIIAAKWTKKIIEDLNDYLFTGKAKFLNVNVPSGKIKGYKVTVLGKRFYSGEDILVKKDPRGKYYYWLSSQVRSPKDNENTDVSAVKSGYVTITPLTVNTTDVNEFTELKSNLDKRL